MKEVSATWAVVALLVVGAALRWVQYSSAASLWLDELALAQAILSTDLLALLTRPLPFDQVAPKGFLLVQKLAVMALGPGDLVLRLFPFLCSLLVLPAFAWLARRALAPAGALVAILLFATAAPLIAFAGIVKQYSVDVLAAVVLASLALELSTRPVTARVAWRAAAAGALLPWFSQAAVLVAAALAVPMLVWLSPDVPRARKQRLAIVLAGWGGSAAVATAVSLASMTADSRDYLRIFWSDGFASLAGIASLDWPWTNLGRLLGTGPGIQAGLAYPRPPLYPLLAACGAGLLLLRHQRVAAIVLGPIVVTLGAAAARQYPFIDQLVLFLIPFLIIAIGAAAAAAYAVVARRSSPAAIGVVLVLTLPALAPIATTPPPYQVENIKPVLEYVRQRHRSGDAVYVYYGAAPAVSRYAAGFGFERSSYTIGGCHRGDSVRYLEELDLFRGRSRVWVVFTHALPAYREQDDMLAYLDTIGRRLDEVSIQTHTAGWRRLPAEAFLYDLSDARRPADAQSFALMGSPRLFEHHNCGRGPQSMIQSDF